ncbi:hypothetical protein SAMN04515695_2498 [Pseudovibrio sp. Tun.PSC04-5.I4]|nr:hypothetical protein SAMN04515695_2498 [Pseudovibrio sp. Tun.PSC04-5.I4]
MKVNGGIGVIVGRSTLSINKMYHIQVINRSDGISNLKMVVFCSFRTPVPSWISKGKHS